MKNRQYLMFFSVVFATTVFAVSSCSKRPDERIKAAVTYQMALYPESTLQDLYKAFFQAEFGPEHIISDTVSAARMLDEELSIADNSTLFYEPVGADSAFFRIHLCAVQQGVICRDELFDAFLDSAGKTERIDSENWPGKWNDIERAIESMDLDIENYIYDKCLIDSLLQSGQFAVHHSAKFNDLYRPHYRIIRKDIFEERLYDRFQ